MEKSKKVVGITRIRNEENIIKNTLDHIAKLGISEVYVYDDCSTDDTVKICENHPIVKEIIRGKIWSDSPTDRDLDEGRHRQTIYKEALKSEPDYIYCFDADEYADFSGIDFKADNYILRLFDFYITKEDKGRNYLERKWMGPEFRDILMIFKPRKSIFFKQRIPIGTQGRTEVKGYVKHYGKAISIRQWEEICSYYLKYFPRYRRWRTRSGKAIHTVSDFGRPLITWEERFNRDKIIKIK